ncbi:hypothetical protein GCM10023205_67950 [Yinghuangia aomiensis]|uniref:Uncharacterized protein n=1 Tax=Yinghuangia aomiensis TaxID=676205 RepID=A0ABP9I526_9ACTN
MGELEGAGAALPIVSDHLGPTAEDTYDIRYRKTDVSRAPAAPGPHLMTTRGAGTRGTAWRTAATCGSVRHKTTTRVRSPALPTPLPNHRPPSVDAGRPWSLDALPARAATARRPACRVVAYPAGGFVMVSSVRNAWPQTHPREAGASAATWPRR